ncbi:MAG: ABC transporter substrate-binding protein [Actinobacteria bacterium]|nr:ABC transporter substrate-binding protein [Actinomycetota bacterium]
MRSRWSRGKAPRFAALVVFAMVLAACGTGATTTTSGTATTSTTLTTTSTTTPGGSSSTTTQAPPAAPTGVVSTYITEPKSLTTLDDNESEGIAVLDALYTPLITYDPKTSKPAPGVAESIKSTDGGTTWVIKLKPGWTFHDGTPVTAQSFVDAWNYGAYGPNAQKNAGFFAEIAGYDAVNPASGTPTAKTLSGLVVDNDLQFTVTLSQPETFFSEKLGYPAYAPLPEAFFKDPKAFNEAPIGNGPFMMDGTWNHDVAIKVKAYPNYAGAKKAQIAGIEFRIYADVNTAVSDLEAGNLDIVDAVPPERWAEVKKQVPNYDQSPSSGINYIGFPMYDPALGGAANKNLRAALSMAIDRKAITDKIFNGTRAPAGDLLSPVIPGHQDTVCDNWTYNPTKAKELFDAAGGWTGTLNVWFNEGAAHQAWIEAVTNQWVNNLGIPADSIKFQQLPWAQYLQKLDGAKVDGPFRLGWGMDYPHPQDYLELILAGWMKPEMGGANDTFFDNADFNAALKKALAESDLQTAIPLYQAADKIACENVPLTPIFYGQNQYAWNSPVSGVYVDAFANLVYTDLTKSSK